MPVPPKVKSIEITNNSVNHEREVILNYISNRKNNLELIEDGDDGDDVDNISIGKKAILIEIETWLKKRMGLLGESYGIAKKINSDKFSAF